VSEQDDTIRALAGLIRAAVFGNSSTTSDAEAVVTRLGIGPDDPVSVNAIKARLRDALGLAESGPASGDGLRVRIHAHLRRHPNLTAGEIARALQLPDPRGTGQTRTRRLLVRMHHDGEAERTVGPKDETDQRPTARWRAT